MLNRICRAITSVLLVASIVLCGSVGSFVQPAAAVNNALTQRLMELRSTSPESGIYDVTSKTFDVAVVDAMLEDLQAMSEECAMGMESTNADFAAKAATWHDEMETVVAELQQKRSSLVRSRFESLKSVSPESGIS